MNEYIKQAKDFLTKTNTTMEINFLKRDFHFKGDKEKRNIYEVTLTRGSRKYTFNFGDSIINTQKNVITPLSEKIILSKYDRRLYTIKLIGIAKRQVKNYLPSEYSILSCLNVFEGEYEDFCNEFDYDVDSITAEKTYKAVKNESDNLKMLFSDDEINELQNIN